MPFIGIRALLTDLFSNLFCLFTPPTCCLIFRLVHLSSFIALILFIKKFALYFNDYSFYHSFDVCGPSLTNNTNFFSQPFSSRAFFFLKSWHFVLVFMKPFVIVPFFKVLTYQFPRRIFQNLLLQLLSIALLILCKPCIDVILILNLSLLFTFQISCYFAISIIRI